MMNEQANLLQESLEKLEAGEKLEDAQQSLSAEEHSSLLLVSRLRSTAWQGRNPHNISTQRHKIITLYAQQPQNQPRFGLIKDWRLPAAIAVVAVAMLVCGLMTVFGVGASLWYGSQRANVSPPSEVNVTEQIESADTPAIATDPFESLAPHEAFLTDLQGLVEIQVDEAWQPVSDDTILAVNSHLRTASFSSVSLNFKDHSQAKIGPNSEIIIVTLVADPVNETRDISLMQLSGESSHDVVPFETKETSYQVNTPSAQGKVKGTQFHVRVTPEQTNWYVDSGAVEVSGKEVSVQVKSGEMTNVVMDEEPIEPVYFIAGQGEVAFNGKEWVIGDQTYQTHAQTVIIGNPQEGDIVFFEGQLREDGTRVADLIVLVRRNPANTFTLTGEVQAMNDTLWTVNGQTIAVTDLSDVEPGIVVGDLVRIKGFILTDGTLQAEEVRLILDENSIPFEFPGVVQQIGEQNWLISGINVAIDENTALDEGLLVGDSVQAQGWILDDGTWLATSITRFLDQNSAFEFFGHLESMDPWVVAGILFEVQDWTTIDVSLQVGDLVRVAGQIQADGTWVATEIQHYDEALLTILIGRVFNLDPWVVSGFELNVDAETIIEGEITVGMLVRVELQLFPDGTQKVIRIAPMEGFDWEMGCQYLVVTFIGMDGDQIILDGWPSLPLSEDVQIEGEIKPGSIIQIMICYDENMNVVVVYIIVIYEPELPPLPIDEGNNEKVAVCHKPNSKNPHTIVISSSALPAHLGHGDILGPCP